MFLHPVDNETSRAAVTILDKFKGWNPIEGKISFHIFGRPPMRYSRVTGFEEQTIEQSILEVQLLRKRDLVLSCREGTLVTRRLWDEAINDKWGIIEVAHFGTFELYPVIE